MTIMQNTRDEGTSYLTRREEGVDVVRRIDPQDKDRLLDLRLVPADGV